MSYNSAPSWSPQVSGAEQMTHCSLLKPVLKDQPEAYEFVDAVMCVF